MRALEKKGETIGIYVHPWELDPEHPKINLPFRVSATHYLNLQSTEKKVDSLLSDFNFAPYKVVFEEQLKGIR